MRVETIGASRGQLTETTRVCAQRRPAYEIKTNVIILDLPVSYGNIFEDIHYGLSEEPAGICIVAWNHSHTDAEVTVAAKDVDGTSCSQLRNTGCQEDGQQQDTAWHHSQHPSVPRSPLQT